jgi:lysyl-tRNA synthetase class 1
LSCLIRDLERKEIARNLLMQLHREVVQAKKGPWWLAWDRLIQDKIAGLAKEERQELVDTTEELVCTLATADPTKLNLHAVKDAATRLIRHYTSLRQYDDAGRLHAIVARSFEYFADSGDPMLASSVLQTAVNAYRDAGMPDDSKRARVFLQEKTRQAREQMAPVTTEFTIPREDIDRFCAAVVIDDLGSTFARLAVAFPPHKNKLEERVREAIEKTPFLALLPQDIVADDHIVAKIGSVKDDSLGRLLRETAMDLGLSEIWLERALSNYLRRITSFPSMLRAGPIALAFRRRYLRA